MHRIAFIMVQYFGRNPKYLLSCLIPIELVNASRGKEEVKRNSFLFVGVQSLKETLTLGCSVARIWLRFLRSNASKVTFIYGAIFF